MKNPADQPKEPGKDKKTPRLKIVIIILAVLLVLSAGGLVVRYVYLNFFSPAQTTATVPDNQIGEVESIPQESSEESNDTPDSSAEGSSAVPEQEEGGISEESGAAPESGGDASRPQAVKLELYQGNPDDNQKFEVRNMLPGDSVTQYFCVQAHHDEDITLFFRADVTEETKALGSVLHIKVVHMDTGKVLCDAPFSEIDGQEFSELLKQNAQNETTAHYQIDVSLNTSIGNEHQAALLKADFEWYVKDESGLTPPQTGDSTDIVLWVILASSSVLLILLLLLTRRRKEAQHG